jgi:hypothetical protein
MTYSPWDGTTASTGDATYQLAFNSTASNGSGIPYLSLRKGIDSTWNSWYTLLNSGNYNSYSPSLTGAGASGTWGINITGNAATASSVPWSGVTSKPTTLAGYGIADSIDANPNTRLNSGFYQNSTPTTANGWPVN